MVEIIYFRLLKEQSRRWIVDVNTWTKLVVYVHIACINDMQQKLKIWRERLFLSKEKLHEENHNLTRKVYVGADDIIFLNIKLFQST